MKYRAPPQGGLAWVSHLHAHICRVILPAGGVGRTLGELADIAESKGATLRLHLGQTYKSLGAGEINNLEIPDFTVITGANGSGKSQLLAGIESGTIHLYEGVGQQRVPSIRLFRLGELVVQTEHLINTNQVQHAWKVSYNRITQMRRETHPDVPAEQFDSIIRNSLVEHGKEITEAGFTRLQSTGKPICELSIEEFERLHPLASGQQDIFSTSLTTLFVTYADKRFRNDIKRLRSDPEALNSDAFVAHYGPAPWDLLNQTLDIVGLPYQFAPPPDGIADVVYTTQLTAANGASLTPDALSSGERVLLAIAAAMFMGSSLADSVQVPSVLLLDEADASLHPTMVKSLLTVIQDLFIKQYGVRVIMTTHSPTTVALAPEESLYTLSRTGTRMAKTSADQAIKSLTAGISTLSVNIDNRRQVFVESEYDQDYLQCLFGILKNRLNTEVSLEFIAAGRRDKGGGCEAVLRLVKDLRTTGVNTVFGLVDRDNRSGAPEGIHYLPDRYSIENLIFDPLLLGAFILRERLRRPEDLGLRADTRHFSLTEADFRQLADHLSSIFEFSAEPTSVDYIGGFSLEIPSEWLQTQGHQLQNDLMAGLPELNRFKQLPREILMRAATDVTNAIPRSVLTVFESLVAD